MQVTYLHLSVVLWTTTHEWQKPTCPNMKKEMDTGEKKWIKTLVWFISLSYVLDKSPKFRNETKC